jgi:phytoene dehydrogenase-like protein
MNEAYDAVIIGAGHNGLVTAALLAQAGKSVLVLERRHLLGGAAATEEVFPGFKMNTGSDDAGLFQDEIVRKLFLKMHGLEFRESPVVVFAPQPDGTALTLWRDVKKSAGEIAKVSPKDGRRYPEFIRQFGRMAGLMGQMMLLTPPDLKDRALTELFPWGKLGLKLKGLGNREMMEFLRILTMPASEYLDEWFEWDGLKGALGASSVTGTKQGPRSSGTTLMMLYQASNGGDGFRTSRFVRGGIGELSKALATAARQNGAEIRTGVNVTRIRLQDGQATGVVLQGGKEIGAKAIVSSADPKQTFFDLTGAQHLEPRFMRAARNIIFRGSTAKLNLALSGLPQFTGQTNGQQLSGHILINPSLEYLEKAYDDAKYGRISSNPFLDIVIPTVLDGSLAPPDQHIMSVTMRYAPYQLRDGEWQDQREALADKILETLAQYAPGIAGLVSHRQLLTPLDWEQEYGLTEGSIMHGQMGLEQLVVMRPLPKWSQYRTPIENLFLCGAGAHPGGGVTGAPGFNAARELLRVVNWG